jgi:hypothetical protein
MVETKNTALAAFNHAFSQLDISPAAGHIRGDGHGTRLTGSGNDHCLPLMVFCIQYFMLNAAAL